MIAVKTERAFENLNLTDDFLLDVITENLQNCKSIDSEKVCDKRLRKLHENVQIIKENAEMEAEFMKAEERERQIREEGMKEGIKKGMREQERFTNLTQRLLSDKRYDELQRATEDQTYCQQLYKEYNIL